MAKKKRKKVTLAVKRKRKVAPARTTARKKRKLELELGLAQGRARKEKNARKEKKVLQVARGKALAGKALDQESSSILVQLTPQMMTMKRKKKMKNLTATTRRKTISS